MNRIPIHIRPLAGIAITGGLALGGVGLADAATNSDDTGEALPTLTAVDDEPRSSGTAGSSDHRTLP